MTRLKMNFGVEEGLCCKTASGLNEKGISKKQTIKACSYQGDITQDFIDEFEPVMRKNPDQVIIHFGTNDITSNSVIIKENLYDTIYVYMYKHGQQTDMAISLCIMRNDKPGLLGWDSNFDKTCLGAEKLHRNRKGCSYLANNLKSLIDID